MAAREIKVWNAALSQWEFVGLALPQADDATFSNATPEDLGTAAAGTATLASRADHVHDMPTAADVGAVGTATTITAGTGLSGGGDLSTSRTLNVVLASTNPAALGTAAAGTATSPARADHVHPTDGVVLNSLIQDKSKIAVGNGSSVVALAAGADGTVLTANSGTSTGLEWAAVGGGKDDADNIIATQVFG